MSSQVFALLASDRPSYQQPDNSVSFILIYLERHAMTLKMIITGFGRCNQRIQLEKNCLTDVKHQTSNSIQRTNRRVTLQH